MSERPVVRIVQPKAGLSGTLVLDTAGNPLPGVVEVHWRHVTGAIPRAWVELLGPLPDVVAELEAKAAAEARRYLDRLGRLDHPDAEVDPVSALGQVAADLAQGLKFAPRLHRAKGIQEARAAVQQVIDENPHLILASLRASLLEALERAASAPLAE